MSVYTDGIVPWNSLDDNTRLPHASELESGYPCGEADQQLFNWTSGYSIGQIWNVLLSAGLTPSPSRLLDLSKAIQSSKLNYAVAAGSVNARTATLAPVPSSYTDGMVVNLRVSATNTAATTLNLNGLGAIPITLVDGTSLNGGEIPPVAFLLIFNGAALLINPKPSIVTGVGGYQNIVSSLNTPLTLNNVAAAVPWATSSSASQFGTIAGSVFTFTQTGRYTITGRMQISVTGTPTGQLAASLGNVIKNNGTGGQITVCQFGDVKTLINGVASTSYINGSGAIDALPNDTLILTGQEYISGGGTFTSGNIAAASITILRTQ